MISDSSYEKILGQFDNQVINRIFWCVLVLSVAYYLLGLFVGRCTRWQRLRASKRKASAVKSSVAASADVQPHKWRPTIRFVWSICYYIVSTAFLLYYHIEYVKPDVEKADGRYFPQYENLLFFLSADCNLHYKNIYVLTTAFHLVGTCLQVREAEYSDATTRFLFTGVLAVFYNLRFEHFFLSINVVIGLYQVLTNTIFLVALHTSQTKQLIFDFCAILHFLSWSYVFLALLPFNYLLPTLYQMNPFNVWLNVFIWIWYGSCVWNSPILKVLYHQTFHTTPNECLGGGRVSQCLLLRETKETKHLKWLRRTVEELRLSQSRSHLTTNGGTVGGSSSTAESQSAKALQTLKCVMTLKRKLKRIREAKAAIIGDPGSQATSPSPLAESSD